MSNVDSKAPTQWLSGAAIWALAAASATLNAWGWMMSATGLVAFVLVVLVISSEVLGIRMAIAVERSAQSKSWARVAVLVILLAGVSVFNAYSGKRALHQVEVERSAPYLAAAASRAEAQQRLDRIEADIAAVPALPANVPAARLAAYQEARNAELARLEPQRGAARAALEALPAAKAPAEPLDPIVLILVVSLIEALKVLGLWAITAAAKPLVIERVQTLPNPGAALAAKRWLKAQT